MRKTKTLWTRDQWHHIRKTNWSTICIYQTTTSSFCKHSCITQSFTTSDFKIIVLIFLSQHHWQPGANDQKTKKILETSFIIWGCHYTTLAGTVKLNKPEPSQYLDKWSFMEYLWCHSALCPLSVNKWAPPHAGSLKRVPLLDYCGCVCASAQWSSNLEIMLLRSFYTASKQMCYLYSKHWELIHRKQLPVAA